MAEAETAAVDDVAVPGQGQAAHPFVLLGESIEQLVEEGKKRTVTVATSRLPHPGTIGMLALAEATGADFNMIPFGGGNPTSMAAITGETDAAVLTAGVAISLGDQVRGKRQGINARGIKNSHVFNGIGLILRGSHA